MRLNLWRRLWIVWAVLAVPLVLGASALSSALTGTSPTPSAHRAAHPPGDAIVMLPMANTRDDLDFMGATCHVAQTGGAMTCRFQQVLISPFDDDRQTCGITTLNYEQTFQRLNALRWVSNEGPTGLCGVVTVTTLQEDSGYWTMDNRKIVTHKTASPICDIFDERPETLSGQNTRRPLPCTFIRPSAISQ